MSDIAPIEIRTAHVGGIRAKQRLIDLVAVPYDEWATVEYQNRMIEESFAPGSFGGVGSRAHRFLVNLEHDSSQWVGRTVRLDADSPRGLLAEIRVRRGDEGDQVLADAEDGMLDGSVGFGVLPENQEWEGRSRRRILTAYLDHIALTRDPAYAGANVVDVRSHPSSMTADRSLTPNLDRIRAQRLAAQYDPRL